MPSIKKVKKAVPALGITFRSHERVLEYKRSGRMDIIPEERYQKYFGWFKDFEKPFKDWRFMEGALDMINSICQNLKFKENGRAPFHLRLLLSTL